MKRRLQRQAGMTLIELLLAVTMFAAISGAAGLVLRTAFTTLNRVDDKVDFNRRVLTAQRTLDQMLRGLIPVVGQCGAHKVGVRGMPTAMTFVSSYSLSEGGRGRPKLIQLFVAPSPNGGVRLLMNEQPYWGRQSLQLGCSQVAQVMPGSFILADRLASCQFRFKRRDPSTQFESWATIWDFPDWPLGVNVMMTPLESKPNQVQPGNVFVPIPVMNYNFDEVL